jgi:hypothetical protein
LTCSPRSDSDGGRKRATRHADAFERSPRSAATDQVAEPVDQHPHPYAARRGVPQSLGEGRDRALAVEQVGAHVDRLACLADRVQHPRVGGLAVLERLEAVAAEQRPAGHHVGGPRHLQERLELAVVARDRAQEFGARLEAGLELLAGGEAPGELARAAEDPVLADQPVEGRAEGREQQAERDPGRRRAGRALAQQGVARGPQGEGRQRHAADPGQHGQQRGRVEEGRHDRDRGAHGDLRE